MNSYTAEDDSCVACELQKNLDLLRNIDFFSGMPIEKLKVFAYLCTRETYAPDEEIFSQGDDDGQALSIIRGQARLTRMHEGQVMELRSYGEGDFLGGLSLLSNMPRLFTLQAAINVECLVLTREKFQPVLAQTPQLTERIFKALAGRLRTWDERLLAACAGNQAICGESGLSLL